MSQTTRLALHTLPHLRATLERFAPQGRGNCLQQAVALVMDLPTARLIIATVFDHPAGEGYIHAWVMDRGLFYDPSLYLEEGELRGRNPGRFLRERKAVGVQVVLRRDVMLFARRGKLSRWMSNPNYPDHALPGIMGEVLLDELGVAYTLGTNRELWPAAGVWFDPVEAMRERAAWADDAAPLGMAAARAIELVTI